MMKQILIILIFLTFANAGKAQIVDNKSVKIVSCTSRLTYSGVAGGGSSNLYIVEFKILKKGRYRFDSAWVEGKVVKVNWQIKGPSDKGPRNLDADSAVYLKKFKKGTLCTVIFHISSPTYSGPSSDTVIMPGSPDAKPPVNTQNVVLRYSQNCKVKYAVSQKCKATEPLYAP